MELFHPILITGFWAPPCLPLNTDHGSVGKNMYLLDVAPSQDASDHQDYIFSRGSLQTFIYHCYWEGATPNVSGQISSRRHTFLGPPKGIAVWKGSPRLFSGISQRLVRYFNLASISSLSNVYMCKYPWISIQIKHSFVG